MSWINLGEVFYVLARRVGEDEARRTTRELGGRLTLELPSEQRVLEAAAIKARHRVSYADAFAVATAVAHEVPLATGDSEILAAAGSWNLVDLRSGAE